MATRYSWFLTSFGTPTFTSDSSVLTGRPVASGRPGRRARRQPATAAARHTRPRAVAGTRRAAEQVGVHPEGLHVGLLVLGTRSHPCHRGGQVAGEEEVHPPRRRSPASEYVEVSGVHGRPAARLLAQLAARDLGVLAGEVEQAGRQLHEPACRRGGGTGAGTAPAPRRPPPARPPARGARAPAGGTASSGWSGRRIGRPAATTQSSRYRSVRRDGPGSPRRRRGSRRLDMRVTRGGHPLDDIGATLRTPHRALPSLTRLEAATALIEVNRYDIAVDLRGLDGDGAGVDHVDGHLPCREPGASTFVDCVAEVARRDLNGVGLDLAPSPRAGSRSPDLAADNVLVVAAAQTDTAAAPRSCAPSTLDKLVYVWTSFEPDDARRRLGPASTSPTSRPRTRSRSAPRRPGRSPATPRPTRSTTEDDGGGCGRSRTRRGSRRTSWSSTPARSTRSASSAASHDLGLYCRQSLRRYLERDADELFDLTEQGLAFFGERFGLPFPQERYDQVFVPNMGGAMENWGCVTWTDGCCTAAPRPTASGRWSRRCCCTRWRTCGSATS